VEKDTILVSRAVYDDLVEFERETKSRLREFDFYLMDAPKAVQEWWDMLEEREFKFKFSYLRQRDI